MKQFRLSTLLLLAMCGCAANVNVGDTATGTCGQACSRKHAECQQRFTLSSTKHAYVQCDVSLKECNQACPAR